MEQPSPPDTSRRRLTDLRNALLRLHKTLLDSESALYDREVARLTSRTQLLGLLMHDPWFAWLRELSALVAAIDEVLADEEPTGVSVADQFVAQSRALVMPAEGARGFAGRYFEAIQRDPDVVLAHGRTVKLLAGLANERH
jgi:hypothetical protein